MPIEIIQWLHAYGDAALFVLLMLGIVGLPVPDEMMLMFCGYGIHESWLPPVPTYLTAMAGSLCGITMSYGLGRTVFQALLSRFGRWLRITPRRMRMVRLWYMRTGKWALTFGYFLPGFRHLTALMAGSSRMPYPVFAVFAYAGGIAWSSLFLTIGFFFGSAWQRAGQTVHRVMLVAGTVAAVAAITFITHRIIRGRQARRERIRKRLWKRTLQNPKPGPVPPPPDSDKP